MQRGWMDHDLFKGEPFTRAMAWEWMIGEAAYQPTRKRIAALKYTDLKRGQFTHSIRHMAGKFQWSVGKVQRLISELEQLGMVDTATEHGQSLITICKYSQYQLTPKSHDTESDTGAIQERYNIREEIKEITTDDNNIIIAGEADLFLKLQDIVNAPVPLNMTRVRVWLENGATPQQIVETVSRVMTKRKSDPPNTMNYFEGAVAQTVADSKRPMEQGNARTQHRKSAHDTFGNAWASAATELAGNPGN